ncbi:DUF58 domain-containing protein [Novipirellula artificiosorum]|uniref:DUF58 domain-containing protein n=1 Tax=Novipirellula artificiosorum TaxID=2528016 RepID=A0A5C6E1B9_9BACT|nr:DUF58 domain-containing protein [Novipirellula artificiosorum]TWU42670.1 hypothetical protein Poly41_09690 [Novipirellula artificiosorum]
MKSNLLIQRQTAQAARKRAAGGFDDERVYVNLHQLNLLQHRARGLSFLPKQPVHSLLSGRHASRIRGRGLNFEEIRVYHPGDDVRTIDWKVTARLRSPHTRVFTEERDRPVLLVVDQRIGMFFGTQLNMKSVTAAQVAALSAWRVLDSGDRVGGIVFNDSAVETITPHRSRQTVEKILQTVVQFNHQLSADSAAQPNAAKFNQVLEQVVRIAKHDYLITLVSDFFGCDDQSFRYLQRIRQHNDVIAAFVHDPSASKLPTSRDFVITDGDLQVELALSGKRMRQRIEDSTSGRIANVLALQNRLQMPVLPISTAEQVSNQLHKLLGHAARSLQP